MKKIKPTVGALASDLLVKAPDTRSPIEQMREQLSEYELNIWEAVERGKKLYDTSDFYVHVETKRERILENVFRNYFISRKSCPTPNYDQTVYRYDKAKDEVEFLWVIPSRDACFHLLQNALYVHPEERKLLENVIAFNSGELFKKCKILNGEQEDSPLLEKTGTACLK